MVIKPDKSTGFDWNGLIDPTQQTSMGLITILPRRVMVIQPDKSTGFDCHCLIDPTH
jgi:hypothetical protein